MGLLNWKDKLFSSKVPPKVFKERLTPFTNSAKSENNAPNSATSDQNSSEVSRRTAPNTTTTLTGPLLMPRPKNTTTNSSFNLRAETTNSLPEISTVSDPTPLVMLLLVWLSMEMINKRSTPNKTPWPSPPRENGKTARSVANGSTIMTNFAHQWA